MAERVMNGWRAIKIRECLYLQGQNINFRILNETKSH